MKKTICKVISAAILGVSLNILGTTVIPSTPVYASIQEDGLKNQCIYREGDYIIAKEHASYLALTSGVWMEFKYYRTPTYCIGYDAPNNVGTKTFEDGTVVTVEEDNEGYLITYKIKKDTIPHLELEKAIFQTELFGANNYPYYRDDNGGYGYSL